MYTIKEAAEISGLSAYALRYYEKEGILPPISRDGGGRRVYSQENLVWLEIVACLKQTHMPVTEIKEIVRLSILGDQTIGERKTMLLDHRKVMVDQVNALKESIKKIDKKIAFYDGSGSC